MESGLPQGYEEIGAITLAAGRAAGVQALSLLLGLATLVALLLASGVRSFTAGPGDILAVLAGTLGVVALHEGVHRLAHASWGLRPGSARESSTGCPSSPRPSTARTGGPRPWSG